MNKVIAFLWIAVVSYLFVWLGPMAIAWFVGALPL